MTAQQFATTEDGMRQLLAALDEQITNMGRSQSTVLGVQSDVAGHYQSNAANTFQGKVTEWLTTYTDVIRRVTSVREALQTSNTLFQQTDEENLNLASSWGADTYAALTPR